MTLKGKSRNVLASPLGEEGHEVAKGWTVVILIMILDVDVTAERRHYNTHRPLKGKRLTTFCASLALLHPLLSLTHWIFRSLMLPYKSSSHSAKCVRCAPKGNPQPSALWAVKLKNPPAPGRSILRTFLCTTLFHNPSTQPVADRRPQPSGRSPVNPHAAGVSVGEAASTFPPRFPREKKL